MTVGALLLGVALPHPSDAKIGASYAGSATVATLDTGTLPESFHPVALAIAKSGATIVADRGGSRIWSISPDGLASIIAGPPEGTPQDAMAGDIDGQASSARFDHPGGVAVRADGAIYVADTGNVCIRLIDHDVVSTAFGRCGRPGTNDGSAAEATFTKPQGLALAADGTLFVADGPGGVRRIANGRVATLGVSQSDPHDANDVSVFEEREPEQITWIFYATRDGFGRFNVRTNQTEGFVPGPGISGIVGVAPERAVCSVAARHAIYFSDLETIRRLVSGNDSRASDVAGAYRDGPAPQARFDSPMGMALEDDGRMLVADTGNRHVRTLPALDLRWRITNGSYVPQKMPGVYRIEYVSNSVAWYNTMWGDSIEGKLEAYLNAHAGELGIRRTVRVDALRFEGGRLTPLAQEIRERLGQGGADLVIWNVDAFMFLDNDYQNISSLPTFDATHIAAWSTEFTKTKAELTENGTQLLVIDQPLGMYAGPAENYELKELQGALAPPDRRQALRSAEYGDESYRAIEDVIAATHVDFYPTYERYLTHERGPHAPLYMAMDFHPQPRGNAFHADLVIDALRRFRPWRT